MLPTRIIMGGKRISRQRPYYLISEDQQQVPKVAYFNSDRNCQQINFMLLTKLYYLTQIQCLIYKLKMLQLAKRISHSFSVLYPHNPNLSTNKLTFHSNKIRKILLNQQSILPIFQTQKLQVGRHFANHMIQIDYDSDFGWSSPLFTSFPQTDIHPLNACFKHAVQCFQGTKVCKNKEGEIRLFRVEQNALRFKRQSLRLNFPDFDGQQLINLMVELAKQDKRWISCDEECSLQIIPLHLTTSTQFVSHSHSQSKILIAASPTRTCSKQGIKPLSLHYDSLQTIHPSPKELSNYKIGGLIRNYKTNREAKQLGHQSVLWLHNEKVIGAGAQNVFFAFKDKNGLIQVTTPELEDFVHPGLTRDSILEFLNDNKQYKVTERPILIGEVIERQQKGQLVECFAVNTEAVVEPISNISYKRNNYPIPIDKIATSISHLIRKSILDIQQGRSQDKYGWITRVK